MTTTVATAMPNLFFFQQPQRQAPRRAPVRRRVSPEQGRALEALGHAIEYLVDSWLHERWESAADAEAVQMLMERSRAVFAECAEVRPWHVRAQHQVTKRFQLAPSR